VRLPRAQENGQKAVEDEYREQVADIRDDNASNEEVLQRGLGIFDAVCMGVNVEARKQVY
jgi:hypothetical protein